MQMGLSEILTWHEPDSFSLSDQPRLGKRSSHPAGAQGVLRSTLVTLSFLLQLLGLGPRRHAK
jgi:hypothetical protein